MLGETYYICLCVQKLLIMHGAVFGRVRVSVLRQLDTRGDCRCARRQRDERGIVSNLLRVASTFASVLIVCTHTRTHSLTRAY